MEQDTSSGAAYLVIEKGPSLSKRVEIWKDSTTIGRSRDCDIFLEDIAVHRKQASIVRSSSGYILRDDHGSGDSFVNGHPVQHQLLSNGDQLLFGSTRMTFYANEGTRPFQLASSRGRELHIGKSHDPHVSTTAYLHPMGGRIGVRGFDVFTEMTIGRSRECDIFLEDLAVSRVHATIRELPNGEYELIDNQSATGTFVNGQPIQRYMLCENDMVQIGASRFVFRHARQ